MSPNVDKNKNGNICYRFFYKNTMLLFKISICSFIDFIGFYLHSHLHSHLIDGECIRHFHPVYLFVVRERCRDGHFLPLCLYFLVSPVFSPVATL